MKNERWLTKIKERIENHSEMLPAYGWEAIEEELSRSALTGDVQKRPVPLFRRLTVAAAILLAAASGISLWLWQEDASSLHVLPPSEAGQQQVVLSDNKQPAAPKEEAATEPLDKDIYTPGKALIAQANPMRTESYTETKLRSEQPTGIVPETESSDVREKEEPADKQQVPDEQAYGQKRAAQSSPVKESLYLAQENRKKNKSKGWSVGLSMGNTGSMNRTAMSGRALGQYATVSNEDEQSDLSVADGIITIPEGEEVIFNNGMPYLRKRSKQISSINHKMPVSAGISVRKALAKGFSIESGLTYTYLASEIHYEGVSGTSEQKLHYIGIPLRASWNFVERQAVTFYVSAGGMVEKCVYGTVDGQEHTVKPLQLSVTGAVGAQANISRHFGIYVEPGVSYFFDDGSDIQTVRKENPCNFTLQAGIRLKY